MSLFILFYLNPCTVYKGLTKKIDVMQGMTQISMANHNNDIKSHSYFCINLL